MDKAKDLVGLKTEKSPRTRPPRGTLGAIADKVDDAIDQIKGTKD